MGHAEEIVSGIPHVILQGMLDRAAEEKPCACGRFTKRRVTALAVSTNGDFSDPHGLQSTAASARYRCEHCKEVHKMTQVFYEPVP